MDACRNISCVYLKIKLFSLNECLVNLKEKLKLCLIKYEFYCENFSCGTDHVGSHAKKIYCQCNRILSVYRIIILYERILPQGSFTINTKC